MSGRARRLRAMRAAAGLTAVELGRKLRVPPERVAAWESGVARPNAAQVRRLALALGVTPAAVLMALAEGEREGAF